MTDQEALAAFRAEIQVDRIEIQRTIAVGFKQMSDKFDEHAKSDSDSFNDIDTRLTTIEAKASTAGRVVWGLVLAFAAATFNWIFSVFKHP